MAPANGVVEQLSNRDDGFGDLISPPSVHTFFKNPLQALNSGPLEPEPWHRKVMLVCDLVQR